MGPSLSRTLRCWSCFISPGMTCILVSVAHRYAKSAPNVFTDNFAKEKRRANDEALEEGIRAVTSPQRK
jgi:hypothetical protein